MVFRKKTDATDASALDAELPPVLSADAADAPTREPLAEEIQAAADAAPTSYRYPVAAPDAETGEAVMDVPVSPSDLEDLDIGSVARFGPQVVRIGDINRIKGTVRILREGGDPTSFYTASELRTLILLKADQEWPRVVALNAPPKPAKRLDEAT